MFCTTTFAESHREAKLAAQPTRGAHERLTATAVGLRTILGALREGLQAYRRYEHLKAEGIDHDPAIRLAFCISHPALEERRPCHRAGSPASADRRRSFFSA